MQWLVRQVHGFRRSLDLIFLKAAHDLHQQRTSLGDVVLQSPPQLADAAAVLQRLVPEARIGHLGMYRDEETLRPVDYYSNIPPQVIDGMVFVVDPMLATGGSAAAAINHLKQRGAKRVRFVCLVAAPAGVERLQRLHPDVEIYAASLDRELDENAYIRPGLGDAGDRSFGTA